MPETTLPEDMYNKFQVNRTKTWGSCQMVTKTAHLISYRKLSLVYICWLSHA